MTNLERLLEQSKKIAYASEIKDQIIAVMFKALTCKNVLRCFSNELCSSCKAFKKIEQLAAQALGEK